MSASGRTCSYFLRQKRYSEIAAPAIRLHVSASGALVEHARDMQLCARVVCSPTGGPPMRTGLTTAALTLIPAAAFAHTGAGEAHGFVWGFAHPLGGLDHILAMVTVGIFAWQLGGRALWLVPATFVLGMARLPLPFVEFGIAASVIVLGSIVAFARGAPIAVAVGIIGLFAIFHGHVHGTEMALNAAGGAY